MRPPRRVVDLAIAAAIGVFAVAVSPIGIRFVTGAPVLTSRVNVLSVIFELFLLVLAGAVLTRGRVRRVFFHLLAWSFPLTLLATLEAGALAIHLADVVAPLWNPSILVHNGRWTPQLMTSPMYVDGLEFYRPMHNEGISINELGLRTMPPSPKQAGEWRIAITGGSAAWGWSVYDADTIPVQLQQILNRQGHTNVTVYNLAVEGLTIAKEIDVLRRFRLLYSIDQVVHYTGGNDATDGYLVEVLQEDPEPISGTIEFELIETARRLKTMLLGPSANLLARIDNVLPRLAQHNSLQDGVVAADKYCRASAIRCDFFLQPMLVTRNTPRGSEIRIAKTLNRTYPRYDDVIATMYRSALNTGVLIHDWSKLFDMSVDPFFVDAIHINESGNRLVAERISEIVSAGLPRFDDRRNERQ